MMKNMLTFIRDTRAASLPYVAFVLFMLLTVAGIVIDLGHIYVVKAELQNAADAGATAGAHSLFMVQNADEPVPGTTHCDLAHATAKDTVQLNKSDGVNLTIPDADVKVGLWEYKDGKWEFRQEACSNEINAVQVTTRRTTQVNGPVNLIFAGFLGRDIANVTATATAMLGWVRKLRPGGGFPIALGDNYVPEPGQKMWVRFTNNNHDTGSWHTFFDQSADANSLRKLVNGTTDCPEVKVGDDIELTNGADTSVYREMSRQFYRVHNGNWLIILPVVNGTSNYVQQKEVLGFCAFEVDEVGVTPEAYVEGWALGGYVAPNQDTGSPTGDENDGLRAEFPRIVQ